MSDGALMDFARTLGAQDKDDEWHQLLGLLKQMTEDEQILFLARVLRSVSEETFVGWLRTVMEMLPAKT